MVTLSSPQVQGQLGLCSGISLWQPRTVMGHMKFAPLAGEEVLLVDGRFKWAGTWEIQKTVRSL